MSDYEKRRDAENKNALEDVIILEEEYWEWLEVKMNHDSSLKIRDTFFYGASIGRNLGYAEGQEAMFRKVCEMLRDDNAPRNMGGLYPYNHSWADWLESKRDEILKG